MVPSDAAQPAQSVRHSVGGKMIIRILFALIVVSIGAMVGCAGTSEPPLPTVSANDPKWQMVPDHLAYGAIPKW